MASSLILDATSSGARAGLFAGCIATPGFFAHTRRGSPAHLTPDNASKSLAATAAYHASLSDLLMPATSSFTNAGGARPFLNLGAHPLFLAQRDAVSNQPVTGGDHQCTVATQKGNVALTPASFVRFHDAVRPDFVQLLSDEVTHEATNNRCRKSSERTLAWSNECLRLLREHAAAAASASEPAVASSSSPSPSHASKVFFTVQGGGSLQSRAWLAQQVASKPVDGFVIGGLGLGEPAALRRALIDAVVAHLPADKPRFLPGCSAPDRVLDSVARGVDLFDGAFPALATDSQAREPDGGRAIVALAMQ